MNEARIGRYEIIRELGRGGMAVVFQARDPNFGREVAIKFLPHAFLHDLAVRARFEREARTIARLEHTAIVPVYDFGEHEGQPYLVMRYMAGGSLTERLTTGRIPLTEAIRILERIAPALDEAHSQGIIHRDLKPGNLLFDRGRNAFVADFGIAYLAEVTTSLTGDRIIGTPAYMSPEQARGKDPLDGRSDVYSLGVILFEMLTGKLPFDADTPMGMALAHINDPVPDILRMNRGLPPACKTVISQALAKERTDRHASAGELAAALEDISAGTTTALRRQRLPGFWRRGNPAEPSASVNAPAESVTAPPPIVPETQTLRDFNEPAPMAAKPPAVPGTQTLEDAPQLHSPAAPHGARGLQRATPWRLLGGLLLLLVSGGTVLGLWSLLAAGGLPGGNEPQQTPPPALAASENTTPTRTTTPHLPTHTPSPTILPSVTPTPTVSRTPTPTAVRTPNPTITLTPPLIQIDAENAAELVELSRIEDTGAIQAIAFSPDGTVLASGADDTTVRLWRVSDAALLRALEGHTNAVTSVTFNPDGSALASGAYDDTTIRLWRISDGTSLRTFQGHYGFVTSVAISPDGSTLASSGAYPTSIRLWQISDGTHLRTLEGLYTGVNSVAFSPDGNTLASGLGNALWLWRVSDGALLRALEGHLGLYSSVTSVAFSPDGSTLASGVSDYTVRLWQVSDGTLLHTLEGHADEVTSVAFSPDGSTLASGSYDDTIRLWRVSDGTLLHTLEGHTDEVTSVAFSPDGSMLASGSADYTIRLWGLPKDSSP